MADLIGVGTFIDAGGHRTNVHQQGRGRAVVLLHGSGPGVSAWSNWHGVIEDLASDFHVIAPDIAGFGYTDVQPGRNYNIKVWVAHLISILDALEVSSATLVGNSFGGALAMAAALSHTGRVNRLVLLGTPAGEFEMTEGLKAGWLYEPGPEAMERVLRLFPYDGSCITPDMVNMRYQTSARPGAQEAFRKLVPKPNESGPTQVNGLPETSISAIRQRTLVLHGREDRVIPFELGLRLFRCIADSQLHAFGNCGHWVQVERRKEFVRLVSDFVAAA